MKRIITMGMALMIMVISISGCFIPYDDRGGGRRHDRGDRHDRDDRHDRGDKH